MQKPSIEKIAETGVIHGRFQILHNDHLAYLLSGKALCKHLVVGITNPDPGLTKKESTDLKRGDPIANPLTYYERYILVNAILKEAEVKQDEFSVVPFPISSPELYQYYVPFDAVFFLVIYDNWGKKKFEYFKSLGLKTHILREVPPEQKGISSSEIRDLMLKDEPWEHLVTPVVASYMKKWNIKDRLIEIKRAIV
ncbi:MAG: nicotinate-nucleotide adenylyltransferase [Desulfobacterales bacterium]|nr:nicotinate-nucleotide adenylyltransferase [Desulfobacterales bacterium]